MSDKCLQVRVEARYNKRYWLEVAVPALATLEDLDLFLRNTWLECCGHLSQFTRSGRATEELRMTMKVGEAFGTGKAINYVYDFGSSTELQIKPTSSSSSPVKRLTLVSRNKMPNHACDACGKAAAFICSECSLDEPSFFCQDHAEEHECGEEMLVPVVNSPRMGVCGYGG